MPGTDNKVVKQENQVAFVDRTIADKVMTRVRALEEQNRVVVPPNYLVENALQSAYLMLQGVTDKEGNEALKVCNQDTIANALFDMVVQGLNPQKKQCYFIARGKKLCLDRSYFGDQAVLKRAVPGITDVFANVIYKGDIVELEQEKTGRIIIKSHTTKFENRDNEIIGAYSIIIKDGVAYYEIMTMKEIQASWNKHPTKPNRMAMFNSKVTEEEFIKSSSTDHINMNEEANLKASKMGIKNPMVETIKGNIQDLEQSFNKSIRPGQRTSTKQTPRSMMK